MTIGFIGGGNMATALISGLISSQKFKPAEITVYDIDAVKLKELSNKLGIVPSNSITELEERVDIIVLSVKPNIMPQILNNLNGYNLAKMSLGQEKIIKAYQYIVQKIIEHYGKPDLKYGKKDAP